MQFFDNFLQGYYDRQYKLLLDGYDKYVKENPRTLRRIIRAGIPEEMRREIWQNLANSYGCPIQYPGLYEKLVNTTVESGYEEKILKDIHRTFSQHEKFRQKDGQGQRELFNVLKAYAMFDKQVGYVQGMAFIAGFILFYMPEEEAFWFFVRLLNGNKFGLKDLFRCGLPKLHLLLFLIDELFEQELPDVSKHLKKLGVAPELFAAPFIMTLCTNRFALPVVERIWDIFLNEGWHFILRLILGLFKKFKSEILAFNSVARLLPWLQEKCLRMEADVVIRAALNISLETTTLSDMIKQYEHKLDITMQEQLQKHRQQHAELMIQRHKRMCIL